MKLERAILMSELGVVMSYPVFLFSGLRCPKGLGKTLAMLRVESGVTASDGGAELPCPEGLEETSLMLEVLSVPF